MLLFAIFFILLITISIILVGNFFKIRQDTVRSITLMSTLLCFFLSMFFFILFDRSSTEYQFVLTYIDTNKLGGLIYLPQNVLYYTHQFFIAFGVDGISLFFVLLSTFLIPLCILTSYKQGLTRVKEYCLVLLTVELFILCSFTALDLIAFFFFSKVY